MQPNPLFAGLGPFAGLAQTGSQLATRGIQTLFGIRDPEIEAQKAITMAAQNPNDPATLQAAAQALAQAGKIDQAMALAGQARQIENRREDIGFRERQIKVTEQQAEQGGERLQIARDELQLKRDKLEQDKTLTDLQVKKAKIELDNLEKDYSPTAYRTAAGNVLFEKKGEIGLFYFDDATKKIKRHLASEGITPIKPSAPSPYDFLRRPQAGDGSLAVAGQPQGQAGPFPGISAEALRAEQQRRAQQK